MASEFTSVYSLKHVKLRTKNYNIPAICTAGARLDLDRADSKPKSLVTPIVVAPIVVTHKNISSVDRSMVSMFLGYSGHDGFSPKIAAKLEAARTSLQPRVENPAIFTPSYMILRVGKLTKSKVTPMAWSCVRLENSTSPGRSVSTSTVVKLQ